jgi:hypothetical protein
MRPSARGEDMPKREWQNGCFGASAPNGALRIRPHYPAMARHGKPFRRLGACHARNSWGVVIAFSVFRT